MDFVDSDYEFNAPQYVDFTEADDANIDKWFDEHPGYEGGIRLSKIPYLEPPSNFESVTKAISEVLGVDSNQPTPNENEVNTLTGTEEEPSQDQSHTPECVGELCTSISSQVQEQKVSTGTALNIVRSWEESGKNENLPSVCKKEEKRRPITRSRSVEKPKLLKRSSSESRTKDDHDFGTLQPKKSRMEIKKPMLRIPRTPDLLRREQEKKHQVLTSTEEAELEAVKRLKKEAEKLKQRSIHSFKKAMASGPYMPTRSKVDVTHPVDFVFATDTRVKSHNMALRSDSEKSFETQLRQHPPSPSFKNRKVTKPVPFNFGTVKETGKKEVPMAKWESMASSVNKFLTKTPERFRLRVPNIFKFRTHSKAKQEPLIIQNKSEAKLTEPKTPHLTTKGRKRPVMVQSHLEEEEKIVQEMKNYKFKARKFNPRILESGKVLGVPQKKEHPTTEPKPFDFMSDVRMEERGKKEGGSDDKGHENKKSHHRTSCSKTTKERCTVPEPFSFEERDKQLQQRKEQKIKEIYEEEERLREFHAQPLPSLSPDLVIQHDHKTTEIRPFNLEGERRHVLSEKKWNEQVNRMMDEEKSKQIFKAKPNLVTGKAPFQPVKGQIPATEISDFKLNTEERAAKREEFDAKLKEYQRLTMQEIEEKRLLEERRAAEEIALLRQQAVPKANPIRKYKEVEVVPSDRPLTTPLTPCFETVKRSRKGLRD